MSEPSAKVSIEERLRLSEVDRTFKWPALIFVFSAMFWLLLGTTFAIISSFKLHSPDFLGGVEWLTFGRVRSAHLNAVGIGWSSTMAFAASLWLMGRLCQTPLRNAWLVMMAAVVWNLGLIYGIFGILSGRMTSVEWLEMPKEIAPVLALAYVLIGLWTILTFKYRKTGHVYVSQWYILAAAFWFPWIYSIAELLILWIPARGVVQPLTNWWFGHNYLGLWITPIGVATAYYLIPKVLGKPIHSYYLSLIGFWSLALFYNWAGVHHLVGGPLPAWVISSGIVASVMMLVPVIVTGINHHMTVVGSFKKVWQSPTLRFVVFGAINYSLSSIFGTIMAVRSVSVTTHFTNFVVGHAHHGLYAFFTMIMFGLIYFMLPRVLNKEWPSALLIKIHWWCAAIGITLMVTALQVGGWFQGTLMNNPAIPFLDVVRSQIGYFHARSLSGIILTVAHVVFFAHILWMVSYKPKEKRETPTLLADA